MDYDKIAQNSAVNDIINKMPLPTLDGNERQTLKSSFDDAVTNVPIMD